MTPAAVRGKHLSFGGEVVQVKTRMGEMYHCMGEDMPLLGEMYHCMGEDTPANSFGFFRALGWLQGSSPLTTSAPAFTKSSRKA